MEITVKLPMKPRNLAWLRANGINDKLDLSLKNNFFAFAIRSSMQGKTAFLTSCRPVNEKIYSDELVIIISKTEINANRIYISKTVTLFINDFIQHHLKETVCTYLSSRIGENRVESLETFMDMYKLDVELFDVKTLERGYYNYRKPLPVTDTENEKTRYHRSIRRVKQAAYNAYARWMNGKGSKAIYTAAKRELLRRNSDLIFIEREKLSIKNQKKIRKKKTV